MSFFPDVASQASSCATFSTWSSDVVAPELLMLPDLFWAGLAMDIYNEGLGDFQINVEGEIVLGGRPLNQVNSH